MVRTGKSGRRMLKIGAMLAGACMGMTLTGCSSEYDYLNLRNSFLNPAEVGRFDKTQPWSTDIRPVKWPILEQLDIIDEPRIDWGNATDPTADDLTPEVQEYKVGPLDIIRVSIFELLAPGQDYLKEGVVNELGYLNVQNVGNIHIAGLTPTQVEQKIGQMLVDQKILPPPGNGQPGPQVSVTILESRQRVFSVMGGMRDGTYPIIRSEFPVLEALAAAGGVPSQPGLDYIYVIRKVPFVNTSPSASVPGVPQTGVPANKPAKGESPLESLESLEKNNSTMPAGSEAPIKLARPIPTAVVTSSTNGRQYAQADLSDLEAALAATRPAGSPAPAATAPAENDSGLLDQAVAQPKGNAQPQFIYVDGKWVPIESRVAGAAPADGATTRSGLTKSEIAAEQKATQQRVIRLPLKQLRQGVSKYNIIVRPGDIIMVDYVEPSEFYMMGNISRPGVYTLTGRKVTIKQAVAAAGNLGPLALPRKCDLVRRVGPDQEVTVHVNLQGIFDGEQPDIFLKPNDLLNFGTDAIMPFLAVIRNGFRMSYGLGFVYDRNYAPAQSNSNN